MAEAFSEFVAEGTPTAEQIEFIEMIVEHLTDKGVMNPKLLYKSPFVDVAPTGPEKIFTLDRTNRLITIINDFNESASA